MSVNVCVRAYVYVFVRSCVCEWERVSLPFCLRACISSCVRMCVKKFSLPSLIVISGFGENQCKCCWNLIGRL